MNLVASVAPVNQAINWCVTAPGACIKVFSGQNCISKMQWCPWTFCLRGLICPWSCKWRIYLYLSRYGLRIVEYACWVCLNSKLPAYAKANWSHLKWFNFGVAGKQNNCNLLAHWLLPRRQWWLWAELWKQKWNKDLFLWVSNLLFVFVIVGRRKKFSVMLLATCPWVFSFVAKSVSKVKQSQSVLNIEYSQGLTWLDLSLESSQNEREIHAIAWRPTLSLLILQVKTTCFCAVWAFSYIKTAWNARI